MILAMPRSPKDLELWHGRHIQLATLALTAQVMEMHLSLAALYREQIAVLLLGRS